jgi:hypothetical protein
MKIDYLSQRKQRAELAPPSGFRHLPPQGEGIDPKDISEKQTLHTFAKQDTLYH